MSRADIWVKSDFSWFCCSLVSIVLHIISAYSVVKHDSTLVVAMPISIATNRMKIFECSLVFISIAKVRKKVDSR